MKHADLWLIIAGGLAVLALVWRSRADQEGRQATFGRVGNQVVLPPVNIEKDVYIKAPLVNPKTGVPYLMP